MMEALQPAGALYKQGEYAAALQIVRNLWEKIPDPKTQDGNAYNVIEYAVALCIKLNDLDSAWLWANKSFPFGEKTHVMGEGEFLIGKVAFLRGDMDAARENFAVAHKKSGGRIFKGEDPKYKALLKKK
ncbi:MAG: hypothetical protein JNM27_02185 [Leptospirales bacterium]|nr:hypothetical protein [Leptospirales bacterium]